MKKPIILLFTIMICISFCACGGNNASTDSAEKQKAPPVMTVDDHKAVLEDYNEYMYGLLNFSYDVFDIINEHPELYAAKTITMSDYSAFITAKENLYTLSKEIENYNTENLIPEWKSMFVKLCELSDFICQCSNDVSNEMETLAFFDYMKTFSEKQGDIVEEIADLLLVTAEKIDETSNDVSIKESTSSKTFTNKYGTATTRCFHSGCNNYIASTGDTNCCTTHSARCLNCNCYIDEDAMYCMSCLSSSSNSSNSYNSNSSYSSDTCKYTYSSGSVCGAKTNKYTDLCDAHFNELNSIYQDFVN